MSANAEIRQSSKSNEWGDEAYDIINAHREQVGDRFTLDMLVDELPDEAYFLNHDQLHIARADDNNAGTFKWRGALVGAYMLQREGAEHLIAPSAGNHARGAILAAKILDMHIRVAVPSSAPPAKKQELRGLWPNEKLEVNVVGATFDESLSWALQQRSGEVLHPYDDAFVALGQGTIVDDILLQNASIRHIVVPVGGGGLLSGILRRVNEIGRTDITVHGVEANGSNSLSKSLASGDIEAADAPNARYGGSAVQRTGQRVLDVCQTFDNVSLHTVSDEEVSGVMGNYEWSRTTLLRKDTPNLEPTSMVAVAGLARVAQAFPHDPIVVVGTGRNEPLR